MFRAHKIRLYPTKVQTSLLRQAAGTARYVYNHGLDMWNEMWDAYLKDNTQPKPGTNILSRMWTKEREDWAREVAFCVQHNAIIDLGVAFTNFFKKKAEKPKHHKRGRKDGFRVDNDKAAIKNGKIRLPNIGWIKLAENLRFEGKIMSYTISTYADEWYVSVQVEMSDIEVNVPDSVCGVDVGLENHPAYASDGTQLVLPLDTIKKLESKLKRAQKALSRSQRNSHNRDKRLIKKQKVQQKINNIRSDATHKFTTKVCKSHATVVIEDLNIEGMIKKAKFRAIKRAFNSSLMSAIHYQLSYKAKKLIKVPRFFPSSKTCSNCGAIKSELDPSIRIYKCEHCGAVLDRDYNAALNLMKLGLVKPE